jgi:cathepsin B
MKGLLVLAVTLAIAVATPVINLDVIKNVNMKQSSWIAGANAFFHNKTIDSARKLMGFKPRAEKRLRVLSRDLSNVQIPTSFNSATNWPQCKTIGTIYNQAECGSCWAFGCVEAVSDRFCIHQPRGYNATLLSFQDETSCGPCDGCEGGDPGDAWQYVQDTGLVTAKCYPYTIPTCPPAQQPCLNFVDTPTCTQSCVDGETWSNSKHFLKSVYSVSSDADQIAAEIMNNGPVEACFSVYSDFLNYKKGVYQYTTGDLLGGHCVKIIGWGVESGKPYWLINNSWTTYWGDKGQFKILRGQDECGIEDSVVGGMPHY